MPALANVKRTPPLPPVWPFFNVVRCELLHGAPGCGRSFGVYHAHYDRRGTERRPYCLLEGTTTEANRIRRQAGIRVSSGGESYRMRPTGTRRFTREVYDAGGGKKRHRIRFTCRCGWSRVLNEERLARQIFTGELEDLVLD